MTTLLMRVAMAARNLGGGVTRQSGIARIAREVNEAAGGPFAVGGEMDDGIDAMLDFNRANLSLAAVSVAINTLIEQAAPQETEEPPPYLGASIVGAECMRQAQYDWQVEPTRPARLRDIFRSLPTGAVAPSIPAPRR